MHLSVIICTYNRRESLQETLLSLESCRLPSDIQWELLLVDNNSTDGTRDFCESYSRQHPGRVRFIVEPKQGKSFALNSAIREALGAILAFTDDDVKVDAAWLNEILEAFRAFSCVGVAGRIVPVWDLPRPRWFVDQGPYALLAAIVRYDLGEHPCETRIPPFGANYAFRRQAFEKYGGFRTDLGLFGDNRIGGEDTEFCRRLFAANEKVFYAPRAIVYHPVEKKRTEKRFFVAWYYDFGRSIAIGGGVPAAAPRYFGIPRYLVRLLLVNAAKWLFSLGAARRFHYRLEVSQVLGTIAESKRLQSAPPVIA